MKHIVMYSGGIGSWMAAKRVVERYGTEDAVLVFTDTKNENDPNPHAGEDEDTYRFIRETVAEIGVEFIRLQDGRDIWDVYKDERYIGNSSLAPCSHILKQKVAMKWLKTNYQPDECIVYIGIDWTEEHRTVAPRKRYAPYRVEYPMCDEPYMFKDEMLSAVEALGIRRPRIYDMGFSHNNCGGFCCRAGHGQFKLLLEKNPERYAYHEQREREMRTYLGKDVSVLSRVVGDDKFPLTLENFRKEIEHRKEGQGEQMTLDLDDFGGCGCFVNYEEDEVMV